MKNKVTFTVLVASLGRNNNLSDFLASLKNTEHLDREDVEVIIVVGSPIKEDINKAKLTTKSYNVKYLYEERMTKPFCLNAGIKKANGEIIVFTDDDVIVTDFDWLNKHKEEYDKNTQLGYVSGNVLPIDQHNSASNLWEAKGGLSKGTSSRYWSRKWLKSFKYKLCPWPLHKMCAGANCSIPKRVLDEVGPYNVLLETPLIPHGSTLDIGYKVAKEGYELLYSPYIYVYHKHPTRLKDIKKRIYNYGIGDTAIHMNLFIRNHDFRSLWWALIGHPFYTINKIIKRLLGTYPLPVSYLILGLTGNLIGWILFIYEYYFRKGKHRIEESIKSYYG